MWLQTLQRILFGIAVLLLCGVGFFAGGLVAKSQVGGMRPLELPVTSPEDVKRARALAEEALAARFDGDNPRALQLFGDASLADPSFAGMEYQRGLTLLFSGDFAGAEEAAGVSLSRKEAVADSHALLVMCAARRAAAGETTDPAKVADWAEKAKLADPIAPFIHYALGEYARATGHPAEAVEHYRKALDRVSSSDSYLVAGVKAGLSGIRLQQSTGAKFVMPKEKGDSVPPEDLFFAAAQALLDGDKVVAVTCLERARNVVSPEVFSALMKDSFFQDFLPEGSLQDPQ